MKKVIVSKGWKALKYSDEFIDTFEFETGTKFNDLSFSEERTNEKIIELLQNFGGYSFKGIREGVTIVEFDENFIHPEIEEEEYGGENLVWKEGSFEEFGVEMGYCYSYNPMDSDYSDFEEDDEVIVENYNITDDEYHGTIDSNKYKGQSIEIEGSIDVAYKIVSSIESEDAKEYAKKIMAYSSSNILNVQEIISLEDKEKMSSYLYMFSGTLIKKELLLPLAKNLTKDEVFQNKKLLESTTEEDFNDVLDHLKKQTLDSKKRELDYSNKLVDYWGLSL